MIVALSMVAGETFKEHFKNFLKLFLFHYLLCTKPTGVYPTAILSWLLDKCSSALLL